MPNRLLSSLPALERETLAPDLEAVSLRAGDVLSCAGSAVAHVYFPEDAVAAIALGSGDERGSEITTVGREGMVGYPQVMVNDTSSFNVVVRIPGNAQRIPALRFRQLAAQLPALRSMLDRYANTFVSQLARAALCERRHSIEQRLATLLLLTSDRVQGAHMPLTHEQLGDMLGVRRAGITEVATRLRSQSAIEYRRGRLNVNNREHLAAMACNCYAAISGQFAAVAADVATS